jgi:hypothetical protein
MNRAELLVPDGWKPKPGARVTVQPSKDMPQPPGGVWKVLDRGPSSNGWWLMPSDETAKAWAKHWPNQLTQGCIEVNGRLLVPPGRAVKAS